MEESGHISDNADAKNVVTFDLSGGWRQVFDQADKTLLSTPLIDLDYCELLLPKLH